MVIPITSTKNFKLSSGFGVSNSTWPRWARSRIGSGCISLLLRDKRPRHVVEQFIDHKRPRDKSLLRDIAGDAPQRAAHFVGREGSLINRSGLPQHAVNFAHDIRVLLG